MGRRALYAATIVAVLSPVAARCADTQATFDAAMQRATATEQRAAQLGDQWTPTQAALKAARTAAATGDYAQATELAQRAEALAKLSVAQAESQRVAWRSAVPN